MNLTKHYWIESNKREFERKEMQKIAYSRARVTIFHLASKLLPLLALASSSSNLSSVSLMDLLFEGFWYGDEDNASLAAKTSPKDKFTALN